MPQQIEDRKRHKLRAVDQGAAPDGAGFVQQSPEPFESGLAGPARRWHNLAAMKLDGGADGNDDGGFQPVDMSGDPTFLFGQAQRHPEHIGVGLVDHVDDLRVFFRRERAEGRRIRAGDLDARVLRGQPFAGQRQGFVRIAIKVVGIALQAGKLAEGRHQIRSANLMRGARHLYGRNARRPTAVGHGEVGGLEDGAEVGMLVRLQRSVRARDRNPMGTAALADPLLHQAQNVLNIDDVDGGSENLGAGRKPHLPGQGLHFHTQIGP